MKKLVVVGNGMAGVACVEQILRHKPKFAITIFGDETHVNYNRIMLSSVLAGEKSLDDIVLNGLDWYQQNGIDLRLGIRIVDVDPAAKTVTGDDGSVTSFDKLLLATGSLPIIPSIEDVKKDGVFVFRNLDDTRALLERSRPGLKAVVIGGGLLGLEAARGLQVQGCEVTVVHLMDTLMERQLDEIGGDLPRGQDESAGSNRAFGPFHYGDPRQRQGGRRSIQGRPQHPCGLGCGCRRHQPERGPWLTKRVSKSSVPSW